MFLIKQNSKHLPAIGNFNAIKEITFRRRVEHSVSAAVSIKKKT